MNILNITPTKAKYMMTIGAMIFSSTFFALFSHSPTHALSLDLGETISSITMPVTNTAASLPVISPVAPLLMNTNMPAVTTVTPVPTQVTVAPATPVTPAVTVPLANTPVESPAVAPATTTTASAADARSESSDNSPNIVAAAASRVSTSSRTSAGLSAIMKQGELLEAPAHIPGGALMYSSNQLSAKAANILFLLGATGVVIGGCVIFATRPKMGIS